MFVHSYSISEQKGAKFLLLCQVMFCCPVLILVYVGMAVTTSGMQELIKNMFMLLLSFISFDMTCFKYFLLADETFSKAVQVVITWLERGDCSKRNANTFYTMIQSTNSHVRRLLSEKAQYEEELQRARELMKGRMQGILIQCE